VKTTAKFSHVPLRIMDGKRIAARITGGAGQVRIEPQPGYQLTAATITLTIERTPRQRKPQEPST